MRYLALVPALLAGLSAAPPASAVLLDGFEDTAAWQPRADGGQPPAFALETAGVREGKGALRLRYRNGASSWGNLQRAIAWPPGNGALELWVCKERAAPEAALHLWLEEPDGDLWVAPLTEAGAVLGRWANGWHRITIPLADFRFDARGNRKQERDSVARVLIGCNFGDFDVLVDGLSFLPAGTPPPAAETPAGRVRVALGEDRPEVETLLGAGWYEGEGPELGRWTGRDGKPAEIRLALDAGRDTWVTLQGRIPAASWKGDKSISATLDGRPVEGLSADPAGGTIRLRLPAAPAARRVTLALSSGSYVPAEAREGADTRTLGMKLMTMETVTFQRSEGAGPVARTPKGSVAVLRDDLPRSGAPSDPEHLARLLRAAGYGVTFVRALDLLDPFILTPANFDLLVLPYGSSYPAEGKDALVEYLRGGGAFVSTGGYAFNNPVVHHAGRWVDRETYLTPFDSGYVDVGAPGDDLFLFGDWRGRESGHWEWGGSENSTTKRWTGARSGIRMTLNPEKAYTLKISMAYRAAAGRPPEGEAPAEPPVIRGRVLLDGEVLGDYSGDGGTAILEFAIPKGRVRKGKPSEVLFETGTWSPARVLGTGDDRQIGIAVNWVKAIPEGVSEADLAPPAARFDVQINTARGNAQDALGLQPDQIGAFDPSYPLLDGVRAVASPGQYVAPARLRVKGPFEGYAAAGMFGSNSAVFPRGHARWIRLLDAKDADGRQRGALGALALHYGGPFAGSGWGFFGVTNRDLFAPGDAAMGRLFVATADALMRRTFLHGLGTEWACYRDGEAVKASVTVRNAGLRPQKVRVRFAIEAGGVGERGSGGVGDTATRRRGDPVTRSPVTVATKERPLPGLRRDSRPFTPSPPLPLSIDGGELAPGKSATLEAAWPAFRFERDVYRLTATLLLDGKPVDTMESGFTAWDPKVIAAGPKLDLKGNYFRVNGRPAFLCGTNQTGMLFYSTFENPLVWDRDLAQMSDHGVNVMRVLHFSPFAKGDDPAFPFSALDLRQRPEKMVRQTDALVQLCQKHGVALFLSLHDWMDIGLSDEELAAQREWAQFWAGRYRDVPGIFYDVQNEPSTDMPDSPDLRREWNAFLRRPSPPGPLSRRTGEGGSEGPASGEIPLAEPKAEWSSVRAHDYALFRVEVLNRWIRANVEGIRAGDPDALCTVGYLHTLEHAEKLLGTRHTDFSNMHSYWGPADLPKNLKVIDRRFEGKGFSLGEFGAKCHPAWTPSAFVGCTEAQGADYFLRVGHYTLGLGGFMIANWSYKDMIDCVFPWGTVHPGDGVTKDVLPAYRNMSLFFRLFRPAYRDPGLYLLVPDSHRFGGGAAAANGAILNASQALIDLRVSFNVINEYDLERLPATARTLIWPVPYCPDDATYARVKAFVEGGGSLLVTGDLSYGADRRRTRASRLEELCGVRLQPGAGEGAPDLRAAASVEPVKAEPVDAPVPILFRATVGKGRVCYTPAPVEIGGADEAASLYRRFFSAVDLKPEPVDAPAGIHAFRVETEEPGSAWAFFNANESGGAAEVSVAGVRLALAPGKPGFVRLDAEGRVIAVEAQGAVTAGGQALLDVTGHAMVAALDGQPLGRSRALLVLPVGAGQVRLPGGTGWKGAVVQAGEFRRGKWTALATGPAGAGDGIVVRVPPARRGDLFLVCARADLPRWAEALEKLVRFQ